MTRNGHRLHTRSRPAAHRSGHVEHEEHYTIFAPQAILLTQLYPSLDNYLNKSPVEEIEVVALTSSIASDTFAPLGTLLFARLSGRLPACSTLHEAFGGPTRSSVVGALSERLGPILSGQRGTGWPAGMDAHRGFEASWLPVGMSSCRMVGSVPNLPSPSAKPTAAATVQAWARRAARYACTGSSDRTRPVHAELESDAARSSTTAHRLAFSMEACRWPAVSRDMLADE